MKDGVTKLSWVDWATGGKMGFTWLRWCDHLGLQQLIEMGLRDGSRVMAAWVARWVSLTWWWHHGVSGGAARWVFLKSCLSISVSTTLYSEYSLCLSPLTFFFFFSSFFFSVLDCWVYFFFLHFFFFFRFTWASASWAGRLGWFMIFGRGHELQSKGGPSFFLFFF